MTEPRPADESTAQPPVESTVIPPDSAAPEAASVAPPPEGTPAVAAIPADAAQPPAETEPAHTPQAAPALEPAAALESAPEPETAAAEPTAAAVPALRKPHWGRRLAVLGAVLVALALTLGLTYRFAGRTGPAIDRAPFDAAVANLAKAPVVHYQGTTFNGSTTWDIRVTSHGEDVGTITAEGDDAKLFTVAGTPYAQLSDDVASTVAEELGMPDSVFTGKWMASTRISTQPMFAQVLATLLTPAKLADQLRTALAGTWRFPTTADPATSMDGVPALLATTPLGDLYVTRDAPYRILHLAPPTPLTSTPAQPFPGLAPGGTAGTPQAPTTTTEPPATSGAHPAAYHRDSTADPVVNTGDTDFPAETADDVAATYSELESDVNDLAQNSVDSDIRFTIANNQPDVSCDQSGCTNTAHVTGEVVNGADSTITSGQVTARLTATDTVDDLPAGNCTTVATLALSGTSTISCTNPAAGPVITSELANRRSQAESQAYAQSAAQGGGEVSIPYEVDYGVEAYVLATAQVDVPALEKTLQAEQPGH